MIKAIKYFLLLGVTWESTALFGMRNKSPDVTRTPLVQQQATSAPGPSRAPHDEQPHALENLPPPTMYQQSSDVPLYFLAHQLPSGQTMMVPFFQAPTSQHSPYPPAPYVPYPSHLAPPFAQHNSHGAAPHAAAQAQTPHVFNIKISQIAQQKADTQQQLDSMQTTETDQEVQNTQEQDQKQEQSTILEQLQTLQAQMQALLDNQNSSSQEQTTIQEQHPSDHSDKLLLGCLFTQCAGLYLISRRIATIPKHVERAVKTHYLQHAADSIADGSHGKKPRARRAKSIPLLQRLQMIKERFSTCGQECAGKARVCLNKLGTWIDAALTS